VPTADPTIQSLQALGMSGYEAKAYLVLLAAPRPINGYEVAKQSGVPRSTVYETLGKLVARGAAFELRSEDGTVEYVPLPSDALIRRLRDAFENHLELLADALPRVTPPPKSHLLHNLEGRRAVMSRAADLVDLSASSLYVSAWAEELDDLAGDLARAERRGVEVSILRFGDSVTAAGHTYPHVFSSPEVVLSRVGCRLLIVAADRESVLIGGAVEQAMWGVGSDDPALVLVALEFVRHDIAFQVLVERLGLSEVEELFATDPTLLRLATGRGAPGLERRASASR
jgi:sugar-specific transcriptional regulator TrmB